MDRNQKLTPKVKEIFSNIFAKYADPEHQAMTKRNLANFIASCTSDLCVTEKDQRVVDTFNKYCKMIKETDQEPLLRVDEFIQFYEDCARFKPEAVWKNLRSHDIRNDLKLKSEAMNPIIQYFIVLSIIIILYNKNSCQDIC